MPSPSTAAPAPCRARPSRAEREQRYRAGLEAALDGGYAVLERGGASLDAVTAAVRILEDDPLLQRRATARRSRATAPPSSTRPSWTGGRCAPGAVASVRHVRNPVELARHVMEKSRHVLLVGAGAEEFALEEGLALVPNLYFRTAERLEQLRVRAARRARLGPRAARTQGTVGAVARDRDGNLAAATSTGGMTNKRPGRVGDSPIIGAGTYAKNGVCAVSATGHGEYFIRAVAAHHVCAAVEYRGPDARAGGARDAARDPARARRRRRPDRASTTTGASSWTSAPRACSAARATRTAGARSPSTERSPLDDCAARSNTILWSAT